MQATQKKIELKLEAPDEIIPQIEADQALLQQALHNLMDNAIKYTDAGGKVVVKLTPRMDDLLVEVKDTGVGIAPVDMPRVFERFFRGVGQKSTEPGGSGLGLAIVKSIAEKHGGGVWLDSQLGKGSTFFMNIPLRQPR
jgi:signal transduction histidine kinase